MADINIQRKKTVPSPWLLVLLAVAALAVGAYFFLRADPADEPAPLSSTSLKTAPADTVAPGSAADQARATQSPADADSAEQAQGAEDFSPAVLEAHAAGSPAAPNYALEGLQKLSIILETLTDRDDLRDPTTTEQRDNLTSATSRLGEPDASLRPGFVAAASLIRAMQQKAYPELEEAASDLVRQAGQLSGRSATAADQRQNQQFLTQAAAAVRVLSEPAKQ